MAKLYFYYSAMNAGKSTILLQSNHNYNERGMQTLLYTPEIDNRYEIGTITSRLGIYAKAFTINDDFDLYADVVSKQKDMDKLACIFVDEAHFLTKEQILQLAKIVDELSLPVLCYGLRTDFQSIPFEGSQYLLAWADNVIEIKTICHCGKKATHNMRIDKSGRKITDGEQVLIGGNEAYVSTCRAHYYDPLHGFAD